MGICHHNGGQVLFKDCIAREKKEKEVEKREQEEEKEHRRKGGLEKGSYQ
jgi:hypothetical protein